MSSSVRIKRENWKGKYKVVVRDNGKLVTWKNYSRKENIETSRRIYRKNKTLRIDLRKRTLKTKDYSEYTTSNFQKKPRVEFAVITSGMVNNQVVSASSRYGTRLAELKKESFDRFVQKIATASGGGYDEDEGAKLIREGKVSRINQVIRYYR